MTATKKIERDQYGFLEQVADVLPEAKSNRIHLSHFEIDRDQQHDMLIAAMRGDEYAMTRTDRKYTRLIVNVAEPGKAAKWKLMMTDTDMERVTNERFVKAAHGDVLIAGLGIGMVVHALLAPRPADREIKSITVVEKYQAVIDAVRASLPADVRIICADIDTMVAPPSWLFDTIYFDIWPNRSSENIPHINALHKRGRKWLRNGGWMSSWYHSELLLLRRREHNSPGAKLLRQLEREDRQIANLLKGVEEWLSTLP